MAYPSSINEIKVPWGYKLPRNDSAARKFVTQCHTKHVWKQSQHSP